MYISLKNRKLIFVATKNEYRFLSKEIVRFVKTRRQLGGVALDYIESLAPVLVFQKLPSPLRVEPIKDLWVLISGSNANFLRLAKYLNSFSRKTKPAPLPIDSKLGTRFYSWSSISLELRST